MRIPLLVSRGAAALVAAVVATAALADEPPRPQVARESQVGPPAEEAAAPEPFPGSRYLPPRTRRQLASLSSRWGREAQARLARARERVPPLWRPYVDDVENFVADPQGRRVGLGIAIGLALLIALLRLARRPGDLIVLLDYPAELRGTFRVQIAGRKSAIRRSPPGDRDRPTNLASTRTEHHLVARETQFRGLRPGRYWVGIEGILQDPGTQLLIDEPFELRSAMVHPRRSTRLECDLQPRGCAVTVKLFWNRDPVRDGAVAVFGQPDSLRYTRGGAARLDLPLGTQRIVAGSGDRVAEQEIELDSFRSLALEFDLGDSGSLLFKGCPPAVAPYLRGDLGTAARALGRDGQGQLAHRLQALVHEEGGQLDRAAALYEKAGDAQSAVRLLLEVKPEQPGFVDACERIADSFEREGDFELAAAKIEEAIARAGSAGRRAQLHLRWAELLEKADDPRGALTALEKLAEIEPGHPGLAPRTEALQKRLSGSQTVVRPGPAVSGDTGSRYELLERIGTGGMGVVFRALDRRLGRVVALKRLPEALRDNPMAVSLFLREARAAASLNHSNIVTLFDADEEDGIYFITMELLAGGTLLALKRARGRVPVPEVVRLARQVAEGLQYAHDQRIVHRDIKPANLFLTHEGVVKIMDFGLAKTMEEVRRSTTGIGGSPYYMAPEQQSANGPVNLSADLYALGVTFFELLTGRLPFEGSEVAHDHRHSPPPDPRVLVGGLPDAIVALVLQLLEKDPAARPASAAEVASRLGA